MDKVIRTLEKAGALIACASIIIIMITISTDAIMRYAFNAPIQITFHFVSLFLLVYSTYFIISDTYREGDHIVIDLFRPMMGARLRVIADIFITFAAAIAFFIIAAGAWESTVDAYEHKRFMPGYIDWPMWLSHLPVALGAALLVLRLLHQCILLIALGEDPNTQTKNESEV
ncbi:TRAP transporter small permease [Sedimentitalea sp.]|uniref:TRAP transporter small permease n=1 Tax=Sedimentitalea sp. TaxID=2048915 RepID=UPI003298EABE